MGEGVEVNKFNKTVMYTYHRHDMDTNAYAMKAVSNFGSSNDWGFYMPKSGRIKYITITTRGGVPIANEQTWKINNNNDTTTSGEFFEFAVQRGGTQDDTGVSGNAHLVLSEGQNTNHSTGSMVVNHTFDKGDEIRIIRTVVNSVNMKRCYAQIYVEFE